MSKLTYVVALPVFIVLVALSVWWALSSTGRLDPTRQQPGVFAGPETSKQPLKKDKLDGGSSREEKEALNADVSVSAKRIAPIRASGSRGRVTSLCFSPAAETLASGVMAKMANRTWKYSIHLWDLATASEVRKLEGHEHIIQSLAFSPDGSTLASASYDRTVRLWDLKTGKQIRKFEPADDSLCYWVEFSADGKTVGAGWSDLRRDGKPTVCLWDVATGQQRNRVEGDSAVFLPDGQMLACRLTPASIRVWNIHADRDIMTYGGVASDTEVRRPDQGGTNWASGRCRVNGVFSPDGNSLATVGIDRSRRGSENILRVWDIDAGRERFKVDGHMRDVSPIAFSPDGVALACGTYGKGIVLRQITTGKKLLTLPPEEEYAACLTFSPDGNILAAGTYGFGTILIWRLSRQRTTGIAEQPAAADGEDAAAEP